MMHTLFCSILVSTLLFCSILWYSIPFDEAPAYPAVEVGPWSMESFAKASSTAAATVARAFVTFGLWGGFGFRV